MERVISLKDIISFNGNFKTAINLYLSLNKTDKVLSYIPTMSSVRFLGEYANAVLKNKEQATLLVGPYGKGKSHLLLVLLAVLSLERNSENTDVINQLIKKISAVEEVGTTVAEEISAIWSKKKFLPVLISDTTGDLTQAFLFTGIEGRIIEKTFITSEKNNFELVKNAIIKDEKLLKKVPGYENFFGKKTLKEYYEVPAFRSKFPETEFNNIILKGCYPLNPIASYLLLNISEKAAQNERTLFTFISNDEPNSMARFVSEHTADMEWSIGADLIYDYFSTLFKKEVSNDYIHNIWLSAEYAIDKCDTDDQKKIIKALAIILIVKNEDELPATDKYLRLSVNAVDASQAIDELVQKNFIYKKAIDGQYTFKTQAGSQLRKEIKRQRELKGDNVNYGQALLNVTGKYYVVPRKYNAVHMMTRYFMNQFMRVEDFLNIDSAEAMLADCSGDGKVITLYSFEKIQQQQVRKHLFKLGDQRIVVVCPKQAIKVRKQLKDYEIIQDLTTNSIFVGNNEILKRELPILIEDLTREIEILISAIYEDDGETKVFSIDGNDIVADKTGSEEAVVNRCCESVYYKTPMLWFIYNVVKIKSSKVYLSSSSNY